MYAGYNSADIQRKLIEMGFLGQGESGKQIAYSENYICIQKSKQIAFFSDPSCFRKCDYEEIGTLDVTESYEEFKHLEKLKKDRLKKINNLIN